MSALHFRTPKREKPWGISKNRSGIVVVAMSLLLVTVIALCAFSIDLGLAKVVRAELQNATDAAALAGAVDMLSVDDVQSVVPQYAGLNHPGHGELVTDMVTGHWDSDVLTYSVGTQTGPINALRVTVQRSQANGNPFGLFFGAVLGRNYLDISATAIAYKLTQGTRFLIDEDTIDSDVPAIESLAAKLGKNPDDLVNDNDGDWFIDLPPGTVLTLPTGQVGDAGILEITNPQFSFNETSIPSLSDMLNYNEDSSSWRYDLVPKEMFDPLIGVSMVEDRTRYPSFVDPNFVHISPVWQSDVSERNPIGYPANTPAVNALGERRGLVAFRIIGVQGNVGNDDDDDDDSSSVLPKLIIEIVDPSTVWLDKVHPWSRRVHLVQ